MNVSGLLVKPVALLLTAVIASCGGERDCVSSAIGGLRANAYVFVVDATGASIPDPVVRYSVDAAAFVPADCIGNECVLGINAAPGNYRYVVQTSKDGYVPREDSLSITISSSSCPPIQRFTITLQRAS
jgi:hypothetical protein